MIRTLLPIAVLALAGTAAAQINHPCNEVGIYTVEQPDGCATAQVDVPPLTPFTCYVVLTNPWNERLGRAITTLGGYSFRPDGPANVLWLGGALPPGSATFAVEPDYFVTVTLPVPDSRVTLLTLTMMTTDAEPALLFLGPALAEDTMSVADFDDGFAPQVMHPVSGSHDVPVCAINWDGDLGFCGTVPARGTSFGALKALYR